MSSIDRILVLLDNAGQSSAEHGYAVQDETCWRCHGTPGDGPSGVCPDCRGVLLADVESVACVGRPVTSASPTPADWEAAAAAMSTVLTRVVDAVKEALAPFADLFAVAQPSKTRHPGSRNRVRPSALSLVACRHGNPRNGCRDCSMGRR